MTGSTLFDFNRTVRPRSSTTMNAGSNIRWAVRRDTLQGASEVALESNTPLWQTLITTETLRLYSLRRVWFCSERTQPSGDPQRPRLRDAYNSGLEVWGDPNDRWVSARQIWNQHAYHVTNVYEDGQVPTRTPGWQLNGRLYNTYSHNRSGAAPDLLIGNSSHGTGRWLRCSIEQRSDNDARAQSRLRVGADVLATCDGVWAGERRHC